MLTAPPEAVYDIAGAWDATQHTRRSGDDDHSGMSGELSRPDSSLIWIKAAEGNGLYERCRKGIHFGAVVAFYVVE